MVKTISVTGNIPKNRLAELGRVCTHWSILEFRVESVIWVLRGDPRKVGRQITADMQITPRLKTMVSLAKSTLKNKKDIQKVQSLRTEIKKLAEERNWAVHGIWGKGNELGDRRKYFAISYFRNPAGNRREMSVDYLNDLTNRIILRSNEIDRFITDRLGAPLP